MAQRPDDAPDLSAEEVDAIIIAYLADHSNPDIDARGWLSIHDEDGALDMMAEQTGVRRGRLRNRMRRLMELGKLQLRVSYRLRRTKVNDSEP